MHATIALPLIACTLASLGAATLNARDAQAAIRSEAIAGQQSLMAGVGQLRGITLDNAQARLTQAQYDFQAAASDFVLAGQRLNAEPSVKVASMVPALRRQIGTVRQLVSIGGRLASMGVAADQLGQRLLALTHQPSNPSAGETAARFLARSGPDIEALGRQLTSIARDAAALPSSGLGPDLSSLIVELQEKLAHLNDAWRGVSDTLDAVTYLLGIDGLRTFLLIDLDSAELRTAGGFIGSYGYIHIDHGRLDPLQLKPIETMREPAPAPSDRGYVAPPPPIAEHLYRGGLTLHDATWWPDFQASAAMIEKLLVRNEGVRVDGVIGINPAVISDLLRIVGPIRVGWLNATFTADNFELAGLLYTGVIRPPSGHQRKDVLAEIGSQLQQRLLNLPTDRLAALLDALQTACAARDLQMSLHGAAAMRLASAWHCDGSLVKTAGDYLLVTSAISGAKNNAYLLRTMTLHITRNPDGSLRHELSLHFLNRAPVAPPYFVPFYDDYLRIFIPAGSRWVATRGVWMEPAFAANSDGGYAEIDGWFRTRNNVEDVTLVYDVLASHAGMLTWQRQAGSSKDAVTVTLRQRTEKTWMFVLDQDKVIPLIDDSRSSHGLAAFMLQPAVRRWN